MNAHAGYQYPEGVFGVGDANVKAVKRAAARCGRTFYDRKRHAEARKKLAAVLADTDPARLRYWAQVVMIDGRFCGASGTGAYWAVASRCVNELALAELKRRGDAWRAAGLGAFATIEAVEEAGLGWTAGGG